MRTNVRPGVNEEVRKDIRLIDIDDKTTDIVERSAFTSNKTRNGNSFSSPLPRPPLEIHIYAIIQGHFVLDAIVLYRPFA